jgi:hypothetical protein
LIGVVSHSPIFHSAVSEAKFLSVMEPSFPEPPLNLLSAYWRALYEILDADNTELLSSYLDLNLNVLNDFQGRDCPAFIISIIFFFAYFIGSVGEALSQIDLSVIFVSFIEQFPNHQTLIGAICHFVLKAIQNPALGLTIAPILAVFQGQLQGEHCIVRVHSLGILTKVTIFKQLDPWLI